MDTQPVVIDRLEARALFRKYREHQHYSTPIDWEIQRAYQLIAQGRVLIRALASIAAAGVGEDGYPKLAISRAGATKCYLSYRGDGGARFAGRPWVRENQRKDYLDLPPGAFPPPLRTRANWSRAEALVPLIPVHLRPKRALENYHILFEAVWHAAPPVDPMLLRRIGRADLWLVVAAWELTQVELAALAARI